MRAHIPKRVGSSVFARLFYLAIGIALAALFPGRLAAGDDVQVVDDQVPALLDSLEAAINSVRSFDVRTTTKSEGYYQYERASDGSVTGPMRQLNPPRVDMYVHRQVYHDGFRRMETLDPKTGQVEEILASNREYDKLLFKSSSTGIVRSSRTSNAWQGRDYEETFRDLYSGGVRIMLVLRERRKWLRVFESDAGRRVIFEVDPKGGPGVTFGGWGFRVTADKSKGFMPNVIETYDVIDGGRVYLSRVTVTEFKAVDGVVVPVKVKRENLVTEKGSPFFGRSLRTFSLVVDEKQSSWNRPVPDELFKVAFPTGTKVTDEIRQVAYVTGSADPGDNLDALAANAKGLITNIRPAAPPTRSYLWVWITAGCVGVLAVGLLLYWYRRRASRRTS